MMRALSTIGAAALLVLGSGLPAYAQTELPGIAETTASAEERVQVRVGDIFEIIADSGADGSTVAWILTQERTFIQAGREKVFRYRFVQSKTYTLRAEVTLPDGERRQRAFRIEVGSAGSPVPTPTAEAHRSFASPSCWRDRLNRPSVRRTPATESPPA